MLIHYANTSGSPTATWSVTQASQSYTNSHYCVTSSATGFTETTMTYVVTSEQGQWQQGPLNVTVKLW